MAVASTLHTLICFFFFLRLVLSQTQDYEFQIPCTEPKFTLKADRILTFGRKGIITTAKEGCFLRFRFNPRSVPPNIMKQICFYDMPADCEFSAKQRSFGSRVDIGPVGDLKCACLNRYHSALVRFTKACASSIKLRGFGIDVDGCNTILPPQMVKN